MKKLFGQNVNMSGNTTPLLEYMNAIVIFVNIVNYGAIITCINKYFVVN